MIQQDATLNIKAGGENGQIMKPYSSHLQALKMAVTKTGNNYLPTTKGLL
jgi:hypothetical protein